MSSETIEDTWYGHVGYTIYTDTDPEIFQAPGAPCYEVLTMCHIPDDDNQLGYGTFDQGRLYLDGWPCVSFSELKGQNTDRPYTEMYTVNWILV